MFKKMLVLLDGSKLAEVVFTYAQELSARLDMTLDLLHVCSPQEAEQLPMRQAYMEHMAEIMQSKTAEIRAKFGRTTEAKGVQAQGKVVTGYPAEEILKYVDENKIDLVMLSTHGRSGTRIWDLGSVADKVIHAARVPIWIVPTEINEAVIWDKLPRRTLVIPLSGSRLSEGVISPSIDLIKQRGTEFEIVVIHVNPIPLTVNIAQIEKQEAGIKEKTEYLNSIVKRIEGEGIKARAELLYGDDPSEAIARFVADNPTLLLAMVTQSHTGISKMVFGSVAEELLHIVKNTPILLTRPSE